MPIFLYIFLCGIIFSACSDKQSVESLSNEAQLKGLVTANSPAPTVLPAPTFPPYSGNDLASINNKVASLWDDLQQKYPIAVMSSGLGKDYIAMDIRKFGDYEKPISKDEIQAIRKTLFDGIGKEFPLKLDVIEFAKDGYISGKIEKIEHASVLIVNKLKKNGNSQDPEATFVSLTKDGKIYIHGKPEVQAFDKFKIGQEVRAWTVGVMLASYPGQTSALKIEIMD
jgi:hypothetical protein